MRALKAQVRNGRLVMDEATELPEGTVLELVAADDGDELDEAERAQLHAALSGAWSNAKAGAVGVSASELLEQLRRR